MPAVVPIVEGDGEIDALPLLLRRVLHERLNRWDLTIDKAINTGGRGRIFRDGGIERYILLALSRPACHAVIVLCDADNDCAATSAHNLSRRIRTLHPRCPVAVVLATREYETWFLASHETVLSTINPSVPAVVLNSLRAHEDVESIRSPKGLLNRAFPPGRAYKETLDMARLSASIDLEQTAARSRSFRRLLHAAEQIEAALDSGDNHVTP